MFHEYFVTFFFVSCCVCDWPSYYYFSVVFVFFSWCSHTSPLLVWGCSYYFLCFSKITRNIFFSAVQSLLVIVVVGSNDGDRKRLLQYNFLFFFGDDDDDRYIPRNIFTKIVLCTQIKKYIIFFSLMVSSVFIVLWWIVSVDCTDEIIYTRDAQETRNLKK